MAAFIIYIIRWGVVLTLLYSLYGILLKRETFHGFNRFVLLVILVASMVLPLCQIETNELNYVSQGRQMLESQILLEEHLTANDTGYGAKDSTTATFLMIAYAVGLVVCWLRYLWQLASLLLIIHHGKRVYVEGLPKHVHIITHPDIETPCSWMRWIILNPSDIKTQAIINHELAHVRLRHSWDMLLCEFTCRMLWCVPFAWMLRQDLRDVHEYQVDRHVLASGITDEEYQLLLIRKATGGGLQPIVNAFNQSPIKRRFKMMYSKPSRRWVALKAAYLLPLGTVMLLAFATPKLDHEIAEVVKQVESSLNRPKPLAPSRVESTAIATDQPQREVRRSTPRERTVVNSNPDDYVESVVNMYEERNLTKSPEFPGGNTALRSYLRQHVAKVLEEDTPVAGKRTYIQFRIRKDGSIDDIGLLSGDADAYLEASRIVEQMPRWSAARRRNGEPTDAHFVLAVDFSNK